MNRSHRLAAAALALALVQGAATAAVTPEAARDLARQSGLWVQLDSLGAQVRSGMASAMAKNPGRTTEAQKAKMLECAQKAYDPDGLRVIAVDAVAGTLQPADVAPVMAWYGSALGRRIATMEETSTQQTPDPQERLQRGGEALSGASEARKASLQAILVETHSVDMMADTLIEMALAVQQGMASLDPSASRESISQLRANLESRRPDLVAHYTQISLPAYAFTYIALGDDELKQYADYLGTPAATAFNDGTTRGVARELTAGSVKLERCLKEGGGASAS